METLLGFAPFFVYIVVERIAGIMPGLLSAAIISAILLLRDAISPNRSVKILDIDCDLVWEAWLPMPGSRQ
jgi:hypothetical protein